MRIEALLPNVGRLPGGTDEGLYALLSKSGPLVARVAGQAPSGAMLLRLFGRTFELPAEQSFPSGTLLKVSADPARPNVVLVEPLPTGGPTPQVDAGGVDALLGQLGLSLGPAQRTLARALLALGLPVGADTLSALAAALPNLTPAQLPALQLLLARGLPISPAILNLVEAWLATAGASVHLAELVGQARGRTAEDLATWILRLSEDEAKNTQALAARLASLFKPYSPITEQRPVAGDLPGLLQSLLSQPEASGRGQALLSQLRLAELLSSQSGAQGLLFFPLFLDLEGEPAVAWARLEREPEGGEGDRPGAHRFTLALSLSRLGPLQIDFLLAGPHLSVWFFFADERVAAEARAQLPVLRDKLAAQGFAVAELDAVRAVASTVNLLEEMLREFCSTLDDRNGSLEFRA